MNKSTDEIERELLEAGLAGDIAIFAAHSATMYDSFIESLNSVASKGWTMKHEVKELSCGEVKVLKWSLYRNGEFVKSFDL